jgi:hypothetical protein
MGWSFLAAEANEESLTAGEWEQVFLLANRGVPHREAEIDPTHCPTCRIAIAVAFLMRETTLVDAVAAVAAMPNLALIDAFLSEE